MTSPLLDGPFGVYEKALPSAAWPTILADARAAGFDFVEMSIDESDARLARLAWSKEERDAVARASRSLEMPIFSICLSAHRRFGLGSSRADDRTRAGQILDAAIALASDLGVRVIQIAGYFSYYEESDPAARSRYVDGLARGVETAARRGVMLAVENIDTVDIASVSDCIALRDELDSPWFQIYPDVGNLAVHGLDIADQLRILAGSAIALHLKDARPGQPRRVPFGEGAVPFDAVFEQLAEARFHGPLTIEMWNDDDEAGEAAAQALRWIKARITAGTEISQRVVPTRDA